MYVCLVGAAVVVAVVVVVVVIDVASCLCSRSKSAFSIISSTLWLKQNWATLHTTVFSLNKTKCTKKKMKKKVKTKTFLVRSCSGLLYRVCRSRCVVQWNTKTFNIYIHIYVYTHMWYGWIYEEGYSYLLVAYTLHLKCKTKRKKKFTIVRRLTKSKRRQQQHHHHHHHRDWQQQEEQKKKI